MSSKPTSGVTANSHDFATGGNLRANGSHRFAARLRSISFIRSHGTSPQILVRPNALRHNGIMADASGPVVALLVGGGPAPGINGGHSAAPHEARKPRAPVV